MDDKSPLLENNDNSRDSQEYECAFCMYEIEPDDPFAIINEDSGKARYHPQCLEEWFSSNDRCIISREKADSYSIYHEMICIETIKVQHLDNNFDNSNNLSIRDLEAIQNAFISEVNRNNEIHININNENTGSKCVYQTIKFLAITLMIIILLIIIFCYPYYIKLI